MPTKDLLDPIPKKKVDILLVDDIPQNLVVLEAVLGSADYNLIKANSGKEAIDLVTKRDFAVIILDVQMPGLNGYQTARHIKELEKGKDVPIIFVTASYQDDPFVKQGYEAGAVDYFGKPFDPEILKMKVGIYTNLYLRTHKLREKEVELIQTKEILKGERKLKTILETISEGVIVADKSGRITQMNEEAQKIWGASRYIGVDQFDQYVGWWPESGQRLGAHDWAMARALLKGETSKREKVKILSFDGKEKIILTRASPLRGENGEVVGAVAVTEDVTHHLQVESELAHSKQEIHHLKEVH